MLVEKLELTMFVVSNKLANLHFFSIKIRCNYILQHWMILCGKMRQREEASCDPKMTASVKIDSARKKKSVCEVNRSSRVRLECCIPVIFLVCRVSHDPDALRPPPEPKPHFSMQPFQR